jgi:hypothetical protein
VFRASGVIRLFSLLDVLKNSKILRAHGVLRILLWNSQVLRTRVGTFREAALQQQRELGDRKLEFFFAYFFGMGCIIERTEVVSTEDLVRS